MRHLRSVSSSHPISKSLQKAYGKQINRDRVTEIEELSGKGVTAKVDGIPVAAGNAKLMKYLNVEYSECEGSRYDRPCCSRRKICRTHSDLRQIKTACKKKQSEI